MNPVQTQKVNIHQLMDKFQTKKELHTFLVQDCKAYIPKQETTNIYFLKSIMRGEKDYLKREKIKVASVPQIEGLSVENFLDYAKKFPQILKYLPEEQDWLHLDKKWICDVLYTLDQDGVQEMIDNSLLLRRSKMEEKQELLIDLRPEFAQALGQCSNFSTHKGRSVFLLKNSSKRKRKHAEMEELKEVEEELKQDKSKFLSDSKKRKENEQILLQENQELKKYENLVQSLYSQGVIDDAGRNLQQQNLQ